jgi:hypothetical protein
MDPATPVTVGLVVAFVSAIAIALGLGLWLLTRFSYIERQFNVELGKATQKLEDSLDEIKAELFGEVKKLTDRVNIMAVAQSEMRAWVAEHFISKRTAELLTEGTTKSIDNLRNSMEQRLLRIENKVDAHMARGGS